jgi:heme/copper-type cytochrome/quinol oxidase subunit 3
MTSATPIVPIPREDPALEAQIVAVGAYLIAAAIAFFFVAFLFAFFYLRALNTNGLWGGGKPHHHVHAALTVGIVVLVSVVVSATLLRLALVELRAQARPAWRIAALGALLLGLVAVGVQCWQYTDLGFGPGDGGYASVYLGWTGFFSILALGVMLWLEALLASTRNVPAVPHVQLRGDVSSVSLVWTMLGLVEIASFILLYLVT